MDASSASKVSADAITRNSETGDQVVTAGGSNTSPHQATAIRSDRLAKIFIRSKNMELGPEVRRLVSDCQIKPFAKTLQAHTAIVPMLAEHLLTTAEGDMTQAFASAVATRDACVASVFLQAGADAMSIAKGLIDNGQWDDVKFIIDNRLVHTNDLDDVIGCVLTSQNGLSTERLLWLSGVGFNAGHAVAAHLAMKRDLAGLVAMSESKSVQDDFLITTIAKITDLGRKERIEAVRQIVKEDIATWGVSSAERMLARHLEEGDLDTAELIIAAGVNWNSVLLTAGLNGDRLTVEKLLKCDGVDPYRLLRTPEFRDAASFIAYSLVKRDVLEEAPSASSKLHAMKWLLRQGEHYRQGAESLLRDEYKAGNTHAVAILMSAGVTLSGPIDLNEGSESVPAADARRQVDANVNPDNLVKPGKQYV